LVIGNFGGIWRFWGIWKPNPYRKKIDPPKAALGLQRAKNKKAKGKKS